MVGDEFGRRADYNVFNDRKYRDCADSAHAGEPRGYPLNIVFVGCVIEDWLGVTWMVRFEVAMNQSRLMAVVRPSDVDVFFRQEQIGNERE